MNLHQTVNFLFVKRNFSKFYFLGEIEIVEIEPFAILDEQTMEMKYICIIYIDIVSNFTYSNNNIIVIFRSKYLIAFFNSKFEETHNIHSYSLIIIHSQLNDSK